MFATIPHPLLIIEDRVVESLCDLTDHGGHTRVWVALVAIDKVAKSQSDEYWQSVP